MRRTCASWATLTPSCIRLQDAGCRGPPRAALSLLSHPAQFPWLRRHPPAPFLARSPAAVAWWADEGSCVLLKASVPVGAPRNVTRAKFCHFPRPFPSRPHSQSVPYPGNARPPAGPGDAGEGRRGTGKVAELRCTLRSCSCNDCFPPPSWTPPPGTHTHWSPPATCPLPCGPGRDLAASPPRAHKKPRFPAQSGWGRAAGSLHLRVPPGGEGVGA